MMVDWQWVPGGLHVRRRHVVGTAEGLPVLCEGHTLALLPAGSGTTFELEQGVFVTVERREPTPT